MFNAICAALESSPIRSFTGLDKPRAHIWSDGEKILCDDAIVTNIVADLLDRLGYVTTTGYYDRDDDEKNGTVDQYTGYHYIEV